MNIQYSGYPVAVSEQLTTIIDQELNSYDDSTWLGFIIHFHDPYYRAEGGGYPPVEIAVDAQDRIKTITSYGAIGQGSYVELGKALDFDFFYQQFQQRDKRYPIENGSDAFESWQSAFCAAYQQHIYNVTIHGL